MSESVYRLSEGEVLNRRRVLELINEINVVAAGLGGFVEEIGSKPMERKVVENVVSTLCDTLPAKCYQLLKMADRDRYKEWRSQVFGYASFGISGACVINSAEWPHLTIDFFNTCLSHMAKLHLRILELNELHTREVS